MTAWPLISVVIPTYNRANLITDALESVLQQSYRPVEVIVVDDASEDNTRRVVEAWDLVNNLSSVFTLRYIQQAKLGGNAARNRGIEEATGELIAFLDSDDTWHTEKLEKQAAYFTESSVGAVYCGVQHKDFTTGNILEPSGRLYPQGYLLEEMLVRDVTAQTSAYIVRKPVFEKVGCFDTDLLARQDWDMWIRIACDFKIACVPELLVDFREHAGERTASYPQKEINGYRAIRKKYAPLLKKASLPCRLQARSAYLKRMGRVHFKHKISKPKAFAYALGAIACWPLDFDTWAAGTGMLLPQNFRKSLHRSWNTLFGRTRLAIRSH
jgi:glycosyltransferase involved in cell wall biosynthesis